jgi:hypothetical protein
MKHFLSALASSIVLAGGLTTGTPHAWAATVIPIGPAQGSALPYLYIYDTGDTNHWNTTHTSCPWQGITDTNSHVTQTGLPATNFSGGTTV